MSKELGNTIRNYRNRLGFTQKQLGEKLNKGESTVRMWELGKSTPPADVIPLLTKVLDADYSLLMKLAGYISERNIEELKNKVSRILEMENEIQVHIKNMQLEMQNLAEDSKNAEKIKQLMIGMEILNEMLQEEMNERVNNQHEIEKIQYSTSHCEDYDEALQSLKLTEHVFDKVDNTIKLENLFNKCQEITIGDKTLSPQEKEKALQILKLTFDSGNN